VFAILIAYNNLPQVYLYLTLDWTFQSNEIKIRSSKAVETD